MLSDKEHENPVLERDIYSSFPITNFDYLTKGRVKCETWGQLGRMLFRSFQENSILKQWLTRKIRLESVWTTISKETEAISKTKQISEEPSFKPAGPGIRRRSPAETREANEKIDSTPHCVPKIKTLSRTSREYEVCFQAIAEQKIKNKIFDVKTPCCRKC